MDESGFNLHTIRNYGYGPKGERISHQVVANKGQNMSLLAAIAYGGFVLGEVIDGPYNRLKVCEFIRRLRTRNTWGARFLVMDNAKIHKGEEVQQAAAEAGLEIVYLPPYSCDLSPIETYFSVLKSYYKVTRKSSRLEAK